MRKQAKKNATQLSNSEHANIMCEVAICKVFQCLHHLQLASSPLKVMLACPLLLPSSPQSFKEKRDCSHSKADFAMITTYSLLCSCDLSSEVPSLSTSFWIVATVDQNKQLIHNKFWIHKSRASSSDWASSTLASSSKFWESINKTYNFNHGVATCSGRKLDYQFFNHLF